MPTLNWIGKEAVVEHHKHVPLYLLCCDPDLSVGEAGSGNLLVQGDNLLALKALLPYYAGQVKCVYIDPPYNTGSKDWVYNDDVSSPQMGEWLGRVVGAQGEDLSRHDKWLCMIYPRLVLLRQLLREDGVIVVAIDDNELANLRLLMDEVFGECNWLGTLVWEKTRKNDARFFSLGHDYMLVYGRNVDLLRSNGTAWRESKPGAEEVIQAYRRLRARHRDDEAVEQALRAWYRGLPKSHPARKLSRYKHVDPRGVWRDRDISWPGGGGPRYEVHHPRTGQPCKIPERGWVFATPEAMQRQIELGLVVFREDHTKPPVRKAYLCPVSLTGRDGPDAGNQGIGLQVMPSVMYRHTQPSVRTLRRIMGAKVFNNPKDHKVLARLFRYLTKPGDLILDSFAGSGSTGHAVLHLNREGNAARRFILVEIEPDVARNIAAERLRRVIQGYTWAGKTEAHREPGLGGGFRFCELGSTLSDAQGRIHPDATHVDLARHVFFIETGEPLPADAPLTSRLLGVANGVAVYLLYNGVLADKSPEGGNVLTSAVLDSLSQHKGPKVVYGTDCTLSPADLHTAGITFRRIPHEVRVN